MKTVWICLKDLLQAVRDGKGLLLLIVMPLILIAILGSAFGGQFAPAQGVMTFDFALVDEDGGVMGEAVRSFLSSDEFGDMFSVLETTAAEAEKHVNAGNLAAAVIVPAGFSELFMAGEPVELTLLTDQTRFISPMVAESLLQNFAESLSAGQLAVVQAVSGGYADGQELASLGEAVALDLQATMPQIKEELSQRDALITSFQYYTAAMAVMFMLFAGMNGLQAIVAERRNHTFHRLAASPLSRSQFVWGKFFGIVAVCFAQFLVLMLGTRYLYGVSWGSRPWEAAVVALSFGVAVSGLSLMSSALVQNEKTLMAIWPIGIQISSALGGSMVPLAAFPPTMQLVARVTPNFWGLQAFTQVMMGQALNWLLLLPLLGVGVVSLGVATVRITRI
ncbi:ABC transporter permease [Dethiobacter alkaliphilus]|uniref:ABC-2 type transporter n=1 Tax=Dethiobacter alkaliphilus AHT 1 TaxID=555088 RepID=C0GCV7_DETAL|nr:ABC transporter permease [Dethiobacter alkaliphilus]EEG79042.1 ABC-2 type transporter [Dethiobacter alkaliphilus AHT 1]